MSVVVKICGLSTPETVEAAVHAGADMVGFVSFPPSPRHVALPNIAELARLARGRAETVLLSVDMDIAALAELAAAVKPDWLQLHGHETPEAIGVLRRELGLPVMKALPVSTREDLEQVRRYESVVDRILFDAKAPKDATRPGGLGVPFDWHLLAGLDCAVPFMVSGGLDAANVAQALSLTAAHLTADHGVDTSSGVETAPGVKSIDKIEAFIRAVREWTAASGKVAIGQ